MTDKRLASERLYFNGDQTRLVPEGDPEARFLACGIGKPIPEGFPVPGEKAAPQAPNKARAPATTKATTKATEKAAKKAAKK